MMPPTFDPGEKVQLRCGARLLVRPVRPDDAVILAAGFARLSAESVYRRFFTLRPALTDKELTYLTVVDHHDHEAIAALDVESATGVGIARYVRSTHTGHEAEIAVAVIDEWQRRGVAKLLLERLTRRALAEGIEQFTAEVQSTNEPMLRLLRRFGPAVEHRDGTITTVRVQLDTATR